MELRLKETQFFFPGLQDLHTHPFLKILEPPVTPSDNIIRLVYLSFFIFMCMFFVCVNRFFFFFFFALKSQVVLLVDNK